MYLKNHPGFGAKGNENSFDPSLFDNLYYVKSCTTPHSPIEREMKTKVHYPGASVNTDDKSYTEIIEILNWMTRH